MAWSHSRPRSSSSSSSRAHSSCSRRKRPPYDITAPGIVVTLLLAAEAAVRLDAWAFPFILAVTFAASTAFMTPVGYQTNRFVYGPGGYRFTDSLRVGTPLQAIFAVVTTLGIYFLWGLQPPA